MSALYFKKLRKQQNGNVSSSDDSDSDSETQRKVVKKVSKPVSNVEEEYDDMADLFVIDREEKIQEKVGHSDVLITDTLNGSDLPPYEMDKDLEELLKKAVVGPQFEKNFQPQNRLLGRNAKARLRQAEREKTKGADWYNLPATEITDEARRDLELLQMRSTLDPLAHYRKNDRKVLPKYFQVGKVVDAPEDYYSSRMLKKERKKTMVDELLYDEESLSKTRKKYAEVKAREVKKKRGAFQKFGKRPSNKAGKKK